MTQVNKIVKGNDETLVITLVDDNNQVYNLSGKSVKCEMRDEPGGKLLIEATVDIDAQNGVVTAKFKAADTSKLQPGNLVYVDLKITDNSTNEVFNVPTPPFKFVVVDRVTV